VLFACMSFPHSGCPLCWAGLLDSVVVSRWDFHPGLEYLLLIRDIVRTPRSGEGGDRIRPVCVPSTGS